VPEQVHIAYAGVDHVTGYPTGITVSWATQQMPSMPALRLGKDPYMMNITARVETVAYFNDYLHHHARITSPLEADTEYFYAVGDQQMQVRSETFSFRTHKNSHREAIRVAVIGDMGLDNSKDTFERLRKVVDSVDFVWHLGDISYADDAILETPLEFKYEEIWNKYMNQVQMFASRRPYMVLPGNHEAECHNIPCQLSLDYLNRLSNFSAYNHRFKMPYEESSGAKNMWYSFNLGSAHFVSINTETDFPGAPKDKFRIAGPDNGGFGDQLKWLESDLQKADAARKEGKIPWIIVSGHRPIYSLNYKDGDKNTGETIALQAAIEELFKKYRVDLYLCGHVHGYERQYPMYKNVPSSFENYSYVDAKDTIYIVNGAAGNVEGLSKFDLSKIPSWNVVYNFHDFGYGILEFAPASTSNFLEWSYYTDGNGNLFDHMTLKKSDSSNVHIQASIN
jgi:predicted MPP superfamily phosphohydrolase